MPSLNPLDQIQFPVILAVIGTVVVTYFLLRRVFFAPYVAVMEEREVRLEAAESTIAEAERTLGEAEPEAQRIVGEAREKSDELLRRTREEDESYHRQVVDAAMQESSQALERGRADVASDREAEVASLRAQAIECVTLACDKLLGSSDREAVEAAIDKLLARRVH